MFIGHLPAGYLVSKLLARRLKTSAQGERTFLAAGMFGAIAPDLDMLYFYFVDHRQHHHHLYYPHLPVVWLTLLGASKIGQLFDRQRLWPLLAFCFSLNGLIHMFLDTIAGDVWWFGPWIDKPFSFVKVPARYQPWWLNFVFHWTFMLEILLWLLALAVWHRSRGRKAAQSRETACRCAAVSASSQRCIASAARTTWA